MVANAQGKIITFYSYKGGVGRSMILANVAWILASNGKRVLVVDWDLEAPGLHRYFHPFLLDKELSYTEGLIEFLTDFTEAALTPPDETEGNDKNWYEPYANILRYAVSLNWSFPNKGTIDFVPAGKQDHLYATRINGFLWDIFYERFGGGIFLETVKQKMRAEYDYILIDSRTGVSDTSGICTVQMPDILVVVLMANNQSISGAAGVVTSVNKQWQQQADNSRLQQEWPIFPVLARTDQTEKDKLDLARNLVKSKFAPFLQHLSETECEEYWGNVEIPYIPWYAYEEVLVAFRDNPYERASLLAAIEQLVTYLTHQQVTELVAPSQAERETVLSQFSRKISTKSKALKDEKDEKVLIPKRVSSSFKIKVTSQLKIFVSYARVDNEPLPGADNGWVTTLINGLKNLLGRKLGGTDAYTLWMDNQLRGDEPVTSEVLTQLEHSSILLVILSPGYLNSQWCRLELSTFLAKEDEESGRVFIVERDEVEWPYQLSDLKSYKFWVKDKAGKPRTLAKVKPNADKELLYYERLDELAHDLSNKHLGKTKQVFGSNIIELTH
jgi:cellulose biosynthesis protein BcsQ